ncbi:MAG: hypothetical protein ACUVXF_03975, partial [Desulfobaccales bacterium]
PDQIMDYELPHDPQAVKITDKRYRKYVHRFGDLAVELDALHPQVLRKLAVDAIESQFDMDLFREQMEVEQWEKEQLASLKEKILAASKILTSQTECDDPGSGPSPSLG